MLVDVKGCGDLLSSQKIYARRFAIVQLAVCDAPMEHSSKAIAPNVAPPFPISHFATAKRWLSNLVRGLRILVAWNCGLLGWQIDMSKSNHTRYAGDTQNDDVFLLQNVNYLK